jgi:zinc D-Ala-D-Ala carboxypeptidase
MQDEIHHTQVKEWYWPNFTPKEIACKGTGLIVIDEHSLDCLQRCRDILGVPFTPNSAYRSEKYNKAVGGAKDSQHRYGRAYDIPIKKGMERDKIHKAAKKAGFTGFGDYNTFVHVDTGPARYWDERK